MKIAVLITMVMAKVLICDGQVALTSDAFFEKLYRTDKISYTLVATDGYVRNRYDEKCPEVLILTKGSTQIERTDCKNGLPVKVPYKTEMEGGEVTFIIASDIWNEYNTHYRVKINTVAVSQYDSKLKTISKLREKLVLTLSYSERGKVYKRIYENDK